MARPSKPDKRITTAVRLPEELHHRLREAAEEREVSINFLVHRAVSDYLDRLIPVDEIVVARSA